MEFQLTKHAEERLAQRAIGEITLSFLLSSGLGHEVYQKGGTILVSFKKVEKQRAKKKIQQKLRDLNRTSKQLKRLLKGIDSDSYFVINGDQAKVITVGHQY